LSADDRVGDGGSRDGRRRGWLAARRPSR
jgi:hypothetical protein